MSTIGCTHTRLNYGLYAMFLKQGEGCSIRYGREKYDYQEGTVVSFKPGQVVEVTDGDLHKIQPEQPYTDADLDWRDKQSRLSVEMQDKNSRPAITNRLANMQDYDMVYVGFPIWWYTCPNIINTFMESYDFNGKTVIPFATSGGSSIKKACEDLKAAYPDVNWKEGKLLNRASKQELETWVKGL